MILHVFKLVWARKRANGLIMLEILVSFLVLAVVTTAGAHFLRCWRQPLGYDIQNVWRVVIDTGAYWDLSEEERQPIRDNMARLYETVRNLEPVESAALTDNTPYYASGTSTNFKVGNRKLEVLWTTVSPDLRSVLKLDLVRGRWFEPADEGQTWKAMVIDMELARVLFGDDDPIGQRLPAYDKSGQRRPPAPDEPEYRIIGLIRAYKRDGELARHQYAMFESNASKHSFGRQMLLRMRPGTPAAYEENLVRSLLGLAPEWSFVVTPVTQVRERSLRQQLLPLGVAATVAGFLVVMVGMGLMGVLWQNVARRTQELGLRRAVGATAGGVMRQILGELLALTTLAVAVGMLIFAQAPLLGVVRGVTQDVWTGGLVAALVILYSLVVLCGLYPSWLATRVHPARALQYE